MGYEPITWRNIQGPSLADAARPFEYANQSISRGFDSLSDILKDQETVDKANWEQAKQNNTQAFLNRLYDVHGAERFKAMQDSGELGQLLTSYGAQIDQAAARNALDTRLGTLQNRDKATWEYENAALDQKEAPVIDQAKGLIAQGKLEDAKPLIAGLSTRNQASLYSTLDARQQEELRRDREATRFLWEGNEEAHKQVMRPLEQESRRLGNQGQRTSNAAAGIQLDKARIEFQDLKDARTLDAAVAAATTKYQTDRQTTGRNMGILAKSLGLPVTGSGIPDFDNMTSDQIKKYNEAAKSNKTVTLPSAEDFIGGDTIAANNFYQGLVDSNKFRPELLRKARDAIRSSFDSTAGQTLVGNDAYNRTVANAREKAFYDEQDANNWYAPNSANALRTFDRLTEKVDKMFGPEEREDLPHVQKYIHELATKGMVVGKDKNGKDIVVMPSENDILGAVRSTYEGWNVFNKGRMRDIKAQLEKTLRTPEALSRYELGNDSAVFRRKEAVKKNILEAGQTPK